MSSDGKEPASLRQNPLDAMEPGRRQAINQAQMADQQSALFPGQEDEANLQPDLSAADPDEQSGAGGPIGVIPPITELLAQFGQYIALILAPLLFALVTFLFVLARVTSQHSVIPTQALLPVTFIIIAVAIAQGVVVYYSGTSNRMWVPGTLAGLCVFLLIACFAGFGLVPTIILFILQVAGITVLARFYLYRIPEGSVAIVHSMGKFSNILYPGPNILLPWEQIAHRLQTRESQWTSPIQRVQMSPETDVTLKGMIAYQLVPEYAYLALDHVDKWEESLHAIFVTSIQTVATTFTPDDLLPWPHLTRGRPPGTLKASTQQDQVVRWEQINTYLRQHVRDQVDLWGVEVNWVRISNVGLVPHGAPVIDTDAINNPQDFSVSVAALADEPTTALPQEALMNTEAPTTPTSPAGPKEPLPDEDSLVTAYKMVQNGNVIDPDIIRGLARQFEQVAQDPQYSQSASFDAARASRNLFEQARRYEQEGPNQMTYTIPPTFVDDAKKEWTVRRPTDENLMAGG